jgi:acetyl esterase/lipase
MNPLRYIDGDEPATLLLHSDADRQIAQRHPREFASAMQAARGDVETRIYEKLSHEDMVTHLHPWFAGNNTVANEIDRFFRSRMQARSSATAQTF